MQQWEYCSLKRYTVKGQKDPEMSWFLLLPDGKETNMGQSWTKDVDMAATLNKILNRIGADGWELIMGTIIGGNYGSNTDVYLFKRPSQP